MLGGILLLIPSFVYLLGLSLPNIAILRFAENDIYRYLAFILIFLISIPILWLANHKYKKEKKVLGREGESLP